MADLNEDSYDGDHSFIIIGKGSLALDVNDTHRSIKSHQCNSCSNSENDPLEEVETNHNTGPPGPSPIGIQLKLDRLVKENHSLKETLNHSNLAMKNQFETLALWHEEVVKIHEYHKQKFQETQDQIFKLRNENIGLKKLIQQNLDRCIASNLVSAYASRNGLDTSVEMGDISDKEVNVNYIYTEELRLKNAELERKLDGMIEKKLELEKKLKKLIEENGLFKSIDKPNYDECIQFQDIINSLSSKNSDVNKEKDTGEESFFPDMSVIERLSGSVEVEIGQAEMKEEIALMKQRLADGLKSWEENNEKMKELQIQNEEITNIKNDLETELKSYKTNNEKLKEETDRLSLKLKEKDDMLQSKEQELEEAKDNIKKLELMCEEVAILRAQVEVYHNDFNEERKAREEAIIEKEKYAELMKSMGRGKQTEEKKITEKSSSSSENKEEIKSYPCPICWKRFREFKDCEDHVNDCLNSDVFP